MRIISEQADNENSKYIYRVSMVTLILSGFSPRELSPYCDDSIRTLQSWLQKVDESGWGALRTKKQTGRPNKLTSQQVEEIKAFINEESEDPSYTNWSGSALSDFIKTKYGISYSKKSCQNLMHSMGFSLVRPKKPSMENPDTENKNLGQKGSEPVTFTISV